MTAQVRHGGGPAQLHADKAYDIAGARDAPPRNRSHEQATTGSRTGPRLAA
jgi:hypothetical protein